MGLGRHREGCCSRSRDPDAARPLTFFLTEGLYFQVLGGFLAGAALTLSGAAEAAATKVDVFDDRKALATGFDLIYEARDLDIPQNERDGLTQARKNLEETKKRVKASEARIDTKLAPSIAKSYWTEAREELRRQVGTLRFDLNALASAKPAEAKKAALAARKDFIAQVEALDFALRKKNQAAATSALATTQAALDKVIAAVV